MQSSTQDVAGSGKSMLCCEGGKVAWDSQGSLHLEPPQSLLHLVHFQARPQGTEQMASGATWPMPIAGVSRDQPSQTISLGVREGGDTPGTAAGSPGNMSCCAAVPSLGWPEASCGSEPQCAVWPSDPRAGPMP